jgi:hypothetical protein
MTHWHVYEVLARLEHAVGRLEAQVWSNTRAIREIKSERPDTSRRLHLLLILLALASSTNASPDKIADIAIALISR